MSTISLSRAHEPRTATAARPTGSALRLRERVAGARKRITRTRAAAAGVCLLALIVVEALLHACGGSPSAQIIRTAVCNANAGQLNCNATGLGGITSAANDLVSPALVALFAISPIACLIGAAAVMFGHRRGLIIVGSALGALVLAGAVKGIVA